jgi:type IV pilus assembly protein PilC
MPDLNPRDRFNELIKDLSAFAANAGRSTLASLRSGAVSAQKSSRTVSRELREALKAVPPLLRRVLRDAQEARVLRKATRAEIKEIRKEQASISRAKRKADAEMRKRQRAETRSELREKRAQARRIAAERKVAAKLALETARQRAEEQREQEKVARAEAREEARKRREREREVQRRARAEAQIAKAKLRAESRELAKQNRDLVRKQTAEARLQLRQFRADERAARKVQKVEQRNAVAALPRRFFGLLPGKDTSLDTLIVRRTYRATVVNAAGKTTSRVVQSIGRSRARMALQSQGFEVKEIVEIKRWWDLSFGRTVNDKILLQVTRQLAAFSAAGVPLLESLRMLAGTIKHKEMRAALLSMIEDIRDGDTLPQAAKSHETIFPAYYIAMLDASERSGDITRTFDTLANYLERDTASRRAVKSALAYPAILVVLGAIAVVVLSIVVLPRFQEFFASLNTELPLTTQILLTVANFMSTWWWAVFAVIFGTWGAAALWRRTEDGHYRLDLILLQLPLVGPLVTQISMERFCRVLGSLASAGVPLADGLQLSEGVMGNFAYDRALSKTREGVIRGAGLADPMGETKMFPDEVVQILRVGEQTGRLTEQLEQAASFYEREVDYKLKNLTSLLEPLVLLVVGGAVGFVAIALVSAMYGIYSDAGLGQ